MRLAGVALASRAGGAHEDGEEPSAADEDSREGREARGGPQGGGADPAARSTVDGAEQRGTYEVSHPTGARADTLDEDPGAVSNLKTPRARP